MSVSDQLDPSDLNARARRALGARRRNRDETPEPAGARGTPHELTHELADGVRLDVGVTAEGRWYWRLSSMSAVVAGADGYSTHLDCVTAIARTKRAFAAL